MQLKEKSAYQSFIELLTLVLVDKSRQSRVFFFFKNKKFRVITNWKSTYKCLCHSPQSKTWRNESHWELISVTIGTLKQKHRTEMYPSREEFTELIYYISELKHQYSDKIDEQTIKINDQSGVIEELLWQIRELSDKMRQMSSKMIEMETTVKILKNEDKSCICRYENHIPTNRSIFSRQTSMSSRRNTTRGAKVGKNW